MYRQLHMLLPMQLSVSVLYFVGQGTERCYWYQWCQHQLLAQHCWENMAVYRGVSRRWGSIHIPKYPSQVCRSATEDYVPRRAQIQAGTRVVAVYPLEFSCRYVHRRLLLLSLIVCCVNVVSAYSILNHWLHEIVVGNRLANLRMRLGC